MKATFLRLFLWAASSSTFLAMAQSPGTFTETGKLSTERMFHTATLLTNGKVLITGGNAVLQGWPAWASAELYDPSTGAFSAAGNMTSPRFFHTATLLPDGKVLIAGGFSSAASGNYTGVLATAELYDSSTGTFSATGKMIVPRATHTATLLNNGKVLISGGGRGDQANRAELYDPATGTFTATGETTTTTSHTATLLSNGKVLFEGSYGGPDDMPLGNEIYDPDTGTFSSTTSKAFPSLFPVTTSLLTNGKVLVTLQFSCDPDDQAELYDPATAESVATGKMTKPRGYSTATLLPEGKVLIAGREWVHFGGSADLYDPVTGKFTTTPDMLTHREEGHTATLLPDGTVLLTGGWICCGYSINTAEIYHPAVVLRSPVLLSLAGGQGAILHSGTHQIVSADNPAVVGEALEVYGTGLVDGSVIPPQVSIGGRMAEVLYFGKAPGLSGNQVNIRVPRGVAPGSAVGVRLTYLERPSNEVTIGVQ